MRSSAPAATNPLASLFFDLPDQNPLNETFPGVPAPSGASLPPTPVQSTRLANGVRVVSLDSRGHGASLQVFVRGGVRAEQAPGTAFMAEAAAFGSTHRRSAYKLFRDVENFGGSVSASAGREGMSYSIEAIRDELPLMADTLAEAVLQPALISWDVEELKEEFAKARAAQLRSQPSVALEEAVHAAAYGPKAGLGRAIVPTDGQIDAVGEQAIADYLRSTMVGSGVVVVANNVPHEPMADLADMLFQNIPAADAAPLVASPFIGGEDRTRVEGTHTHFSIGLEAPSMSSKDVFAMGVLRAAMGYTPRKARGQAPGLLASCLQGSGAAMALNAPHSDSGLFSVNVTASNSNAAGALAAVCELLKKCSAGGLDARAVARGKAAYRLAVAEELESRAGRRADIAASIALSGDAADPAAIYESIAAVTTEDVARVATAAVRGKVAFAVIEGERGALPRYDQVIAALQ